MNNALPSGTVTFLMTDVAGSSRAWEQDPQTMSAALARHEAAIDEAVRRAGGVLIKSRGEGDSTFSVFSRAADAVTAAAEIQRTVEGLRVRIGVHTGDAELRDGDYFGQAVNRTARLREVAHGGQVLVSGATAALLEGAPLKDLGSHRLRDLARPERVWQLGDDVFPSLRSLEVTPNNLPVQTTSFVGRDRDLVDVRTLLETERLVTLTGAGGCGKTRLALQVAADVLDTFRTASGWQTSARSPTRTS